jgi:hypothetical protein
MSAWDSEGAIHGAVGLSASASNRDWHISVL